MKTSARNQFTGTVTDIRPGAINDEIELTLASGIKIQTMITHSSSKNLGLSKDKKAVAFVKASSVILVDSTDGYIFSARNQLSGIVSLVKPGAVNTEIELKIADGVSVVSIITNESVAEMSLSIGKPATAVFKSSSVMLAVPKI